MKKAKASSYNYMENTLLKEGKLRLTKYGRYVITNRAVPDYRDGLKVVHRRIIWGMHELGANHTGRFYKSARVYGDVMGKYHPHGDTSIYEAMINMVNAPVSLMQKQGNFGSWRDKPAAGRYTEVKLSKTASLLLTPDYLEATKDRTMLPTYDNQDKEPIVLPALFPNLLINGTQGIAYGVTSYFPPIHPEDVFNLIRKQIEGRPLNLKSLAKKIRFNWPDGSTCVSADEDVLSWLESGKGSLYFQPEYEKNEAKRTIIFHEVPPSFNWDLISGKVENLPYVASIDDLTDKNTKKSATIVVKFKNTVNEDFDDKAEKIINLFTNSFSTATNITTRHSEDDIAFSRQTMSSFIDLWTQYRINLEVEMQSYLITKIDNNIALQNLKLFAIDNIDAIVKIIKTHQTPKQELIQKFQLEDAQAQRIMEMQLQSISRLSKDVVNKKKVELKAEKKIAIGHKNKPAPKVEADLQAGLSLIEKSQKEAKLDRSKKVE